MNSHYPRSSDIDYMAGIFLKSSHDEVGRALAGIAAGES